MERLRTEASYSTRPHLSIYEKMLIRIAKKVKIDRMLCQIQLLKDQEKKEKEQRKKKCVKLRL
jgi:uncharacterized UPF0146 family protein